MPKRGRVIVIGSSNTDLVVHTKHLPVAGETVLGGDLQTFAGGKGANQAVAAARAGAQVYFIGAFGDDEFGAARRRDLEKEGIDCSGCVIKKRTPSGVALIAIGAGPDGGSGKAENIIVVAPGANARLTPQDVRKHMPQLGESDVVLASLEVPLAAVLEAFRGKKNHGAWNILNPAPFPLDGMPREILGCSHLLTPNETEFESLTGVEAGAEDVREGAQGLLAGTNARSTVTAVAITRGALGVRVFALEPDDSQVHEHDHTHDHEGHGDCCGHVHAILREKIFAAPKVKPVDTVGAGDCFNGYLAAHLAKWPGDVYGAVEYAVAAAALKVTREGAQAGVPRRAEIVKLLKKK